MIDEKDNGVITNYYKDLSTGRPIVKIKTEKQTVNSLKNVIQLMETPDEQERVTIVDGTDMVEVDNYEDLTKENQYWVDYSNGMGNIYFHPNKKAQTYNIEYGSKGYTLISAYKIFMDFNEESDLPTIVGELLKKNEEIIKEIFILGGGIQVFYKLQQAIADGNELHTNLQSDISTGQPLDESLKVEIPKAQVIEPKLKEQNVEANRILPLLTTQNEQAVINHNNLQQDISDGTELHDNLQLDISTGQPLHTQLRKDINDANTLKDQLNEDVADGKILDESLKIQNPKAEQNLANLNQAMTDCADDIANITKTDNGVAIVTTENWGSVDSEGFYHCTVTHTANSKDLNLDIFDYTNNVQGESVFVTVTPLTNTTFKVSSIENTPIKIVFASGYYGGYTSANAQQAINGLENEKQNKTDSLLTTTVKTVVGGINEVKSQLEQETNNLKNKLLDLAKKDNDDINAKTLKVNGNNVYHVGYKPTPSDIGATPESNKELKFLGNVKSGTVIFDKTKLKNGVKVSFMTSNKMGDDNWKYAFNDKYIGEWNICQEAKYAFDFTKIKADGSVFFYEVQVVNGFRETKGSRRYDGSSGLHIGELNSIKVYIEHQTNVCENLTALIEYY